MQFPEESTEQVLSRLCETEAEQSHPFLIQLHGDYMGSRLSSNEGFYFLWWMSFFSVWSSSCHTAHTSAKKVIQMGKINFNSTSFLFWDLGPKMDRKAPSAQDPATPRCCHHCRVPWDFWGCHLPACSTLHPSHLPVASVHPSIWPRCQGTGHKAVLGFVCCSFPTPEQELHDKIHIQRDVIGSFMIDSAAESSLMEKNLFNFVVC